MTPDDDVAIMRRVQAGEVDLFERLVVRYRPVLLRVAGSKLGNESWAEDVVQETFLAAFVARHTYRPQFAFRTWLWTILLNLCRKQWQRQARRPASVSLSGAATADQPALVSFDSGLSVLLQAERQAKVHGLLHQLDEPLADALRLRFFGELSYEEIAVTMRSSVSGAKQRVRRGLDRLANLIHEQSGELT
ncbi:MAG: RNA polymerase sigma factor [Planctomycetaceae bacterium]|nr:MAG: RNA polymerase sigma factor [Planctomycetaceae bacterium]